MQTIVIIEDERDIAHVLRSYLTQAGFRALVAHDGRLGLDLTRREKPALVILDLMLPGLDGRYFTPDLFAPDEAWMPARRDEAASTLVSHISVHAYDPQTLAYALADSPVGTAAWLWERRRAWSDCASGC